MLIYNILSDLTASQFLVFAVLETVFLTLSWLVFKKRPSFKAMLISALVAGLVALLSGLIGYGFYGGMMYHERFGWPFPYLTVSRGIEVGSLVAIPFAFRFILHKFFATAAFWNILPLNVMLLIGQERRYRFFTAIFLAVFFALTLFFCLHNTGLTLERAVSAISEATMPIAPTPDPKTVRIMQEQIEQTYPEFADFENQPSFAGTSVKVVLDEGEYYFAYLTQGSGVPIAKATCFRVDWQTAYRIGEFPNPFDSYLGYSDVDPKTCKGIR